MNSHIRVYVFTLETLFFVTLIREMERFGSFEGASIDFSGLSIDVGDISKGRCAISYECRNSFHYCRCTRNDFSQVSLSVCPFGLQLFNRYRWELHLQ